MYVVLFSKFAQAAMLNKIIYGRKEMNWMIELFREIRWLQSGYHSYIYRSRMMRSNDKASDEY